MRGLLVQVSLFLAVAATAGLAFFVLRARPGPAPLPAGSPDAAAPEPGAAPAAPRLRPYQTADTLREDLRDALATERPQLDAECWRVSAALKGVARWTLLHLAPQESSPRVRALLVLASGVHLPDDGALRAFLEDPSPLVRAATVLAVGYRPDGAATALFLDAVRVPLGRREVGDLKARYASESDETVRRAVRTVLNAAGLSPPR